MKKIVALSLACFMALTLASCGGKSGGSNASEANVNESNNSSEIVSNATESVSVDYSNPTIVIELGDFDGINQLASDLQNFAVEAGTVVKITGIVSRNTSTPSIMEANADGTEKRGISMFLDNMDEADYPAEDTTVEAVGVVQAGDYFMEFHVDAEHLKVVE